MKILWLSHDSNMSGANICLLEFLQILHGNGVENHLIVPRAGTMSEKAGAFTKEVYPVKFYSWNWPLNSTPPASFRLKRLVRNRKAVSDISRLIRQVKPDFVVSNTVVTPVAALAASRCGSRHIWFVHEFGEEDHGYQIGGGFEKAAARMNRLSHRMVFVSKAVEEKYERFVPADRRFIVHNALLGKPCPAPAKTPDDGRLRLIMMGQIAPSKNQLEAFKAVKRCKEQGVPVVLDIYGKADEAAYKALLDDFIEREGLQEVISFKGTTSHPEQTLTDYDVLLMCSRKEAFGRVTVEALKCGVPVIAANAGGSTALVKDQEDGFLYEAGNAGDLASKIIQSKSNLAFFDACKIANRANLRFNAQKTFEQLITVFSQ